MSKPPIALDAGEMPARTGSGYPKPFAERMGNRARRALGNAFELSQFGVNLTRLAPGAHSALRHAHALEDEFIYILEGRPTLVTNAGETELAPGMCAGFPAGTGDAHALINRSDADVVYLEIGSRKPNESVDYPDEGMVGRTIDGRWTYLHTDGTPFE
ncbi:MAG: cupin domain-containing protein [Rhodanobacteraceae bacterium]